MLQAINSPADLRALSYDQLRTLARQVREFIVSATSVTGGHLGSNLGVVELSFALHRVFDSPRDILLWDTGHQAYVHKIVTGRRDRFDRLKQAGGLSGYPNQAESEHDWIENSHASTVLSYAHGLATALEANGEAEERRVVAVIGDGSMTGGMAYEGLNNLGHTNARVLIVLNDNGRSYAPTVTRLSRSVSRIRVMPSYVKGKQVSESIIEELPLVGRIGKRAVTGMKAALREIVDEPLAFFENLGVRYVGPIDGHDTAELERTLRNATEWPGPIVVHVLTEKGRGYAFAEHDEEKRLHDVGVFDPTVGPVSGSGPRQYTNAFSEALLELAAVDRRIHAITAAMPGPTGLLPFQERFPDRFHDVGIAEQHAVTMAAGMAMGGLRPVVAVYSTFLSRAFDQVNLDVGLHRLPVVFAVDRAGVTGDDGPSHHGVLDLVLFSKVPGMTVLAPSSAQELKVMLHHAMAITDGPVLIRYPRGASREVPPSAVGSGLKARLVRRSDTADVCILAVGKLLEAAEDAAEMLASEKGIEATVWDVRCAKPLDSEMIADAARHRLVVTVEDGIREGGIGSSIADAISSMATAHPDRTSTRTSAQPPPVVVLGTPTQFLAQGKPNQILANLGLDGMGIATTVTDALKAVDDSSPRSSTAEPEHHSA